MANKLKSLATLIEVRTRELEGFRQRMGLLEDQKMKFEAQIQTLREEQERERAYVEANPRMLDFWPEYAKKNLEQQRQFILAVTRVSGQIADLQERISVAFGELKKIQIAHDELKMRIEKERQHKIGLMLDEVGLNSHRRSQEE